MQPNINEILANKSNIDINNDPLLKDMENTSVDSVYVHQNEKDALSFYDYTVCDRWTLLSLVPYSMTSPLIKINDEWEKLQNSIEFIKNISINDFSASFNYIWEGIKSQLIDIYKAILETYNDVITFFKGEYQYIVSLYKSIKNGKMWQDAKKLLLDELKAIGGDICDMFQIYVIIDIITEIWYAIKSLFGSSRNKAKSTIDVLKNAISVLLDDDINQNSSNKFDATITLIESIIKLCGEILIIAICIKECCEAESEKAKKQAEDAKNTQENINEKFSEIIEQSELLKETTIDIVSSSIISSTDNNSINENNNETIIQNTPLISCCPSICPVFDNNTPVKIDQTSGYIVEIGSNINNFELYDLPSIAINQEIGKINDTPIKSIISGDVISKTDRYIILKKNNIKLDENNEIDLNNFNSTIDDLSKNVLDTANNCEDENYKILNEFQSKLSDMNDIETMFLYYKNDDPIFKYIIDILVRGNTVVVKNITGELSIADDITNKKKKYKKYVDKLSDNIKEHCSKNNVQQHVKAGTELLIKDAILSEKYQFIDNIIALLKNSCKQQETLQIDYNICDSLYEILLYDEEKNKRFIELKNIVKNAYELKIKYEINSLLKLKNAFNAININFDKIYNDTNKTSSYDEIYNYLNKHIENFTSTIKDDNKRQNAKDNIENDTKKYTRLYILILENLNVDKVLIPTDDELYKTNHKIANDIINYLMDVKSEYENDKKITALDTITGNDPGPFKNLYNFIGWPSPFKTYLNNGVDGVYDHYLFQNIQNDEDTPTYNFDGITDDFDISTYIRDNSTNLSDDRYKTTTAHDYTSFLYWLKWCGFATLMNCIRVDKWPVGFVGPSGNVPLPVILIPITYIPGKVGTLIGLGICGIAIYPMVYMMNFTDVEQSTLVPINLIIDLMREMLKDLKDQSIEITGAALLDPVINMLDEKIKQTELDIKSVKTQILDFKSLDV